MKLDRSLSGLCTPGCSVCVAFWVSARLSQSLASKPAACLFSEKTGRKKRERRPSFRLLAALLFHWLLCWRTLCCTAVFEWHGVVPTPLRVLASVYQDRKNETGEDAAVSFFFFIPHGHQVLQVLPLPPFQRLAGRTSGELFDVPFFVSAGVFSSLSTFPGYRRSAAQFSSGWTF